MTHPSMPTDSVLGPTALRIPDPESAAPPARLDECRPGMRATICSVADDGPIAQRLMELGLLEGTSVEVIRIAPLGDPMEIRVEDARLSIRKAEARHIHVVS